MATSKHDGDSENEKLTKLIRENVNFLYRTLGEGKTYKLFGQKVSFHEATAERIIKHGTIRYDHTIPIEEAFQVRCNSLRLPHDDFKRHYESRLTKVPRLLQSQAIVDSWQKTVAFAEQIKTIEPIFLYYWSYVDSAIIANRCEFKFTEDNGLEFSFFNPVINGPTSSKVEGETRLSGHFRILNNDWVTFEVYSQGEACEPVLGLGRRGMGTARGGVARGSMVGIQTYVDAGNVISEFKFIILPKPEKVLQKTDRLSRNEIREPLSKRAAEAVQIL